MLFKKEKVSLVVLIAVMMCSSLSYGASGGMSRKKQLRQQERFFTKDDHSSEMPITEQSTVDDYIALGLHNNPDLRSRFYQWKAVYEQIAQEFSLSDPQFSYTKYSSESDKEEAFAVGQMIPWPGKLLDRKSKAEAASDASYYNFQAKRLEIVRQISEAYYEYTYLSKAILITQENMKLLKNFESVAQTKYKSGSTKNGDLLKIQVELGKLQNELTSMEDMQLPLMARLNAFLSRPANAQLPWPKDSLENAALEASYADVEALIQQAQDTNPELAAAEKNIEAGRTQLKLSRQGYIPDLMVTLTDEKMRPSGMGGEDDSWMVMASVNVPFWFGRVNSEIRQAKADVKAFENEKENKTNDLGFEISMVHYKLRDSLRQSQLYQGALIPKAVQTLNATQSGYESGDMEFLSLIDAQRMLLEFQLAYYRHNADFYQRLAELKSLIGTGTEK